jgi:acetyl/propionyl-CoA carboxylase alpha subunit
MPGLRIDSGVVEGGEISVHYDPLISKLIADGPTRDVARRRAIEALRQYPILGIRTNVAFLIKLLAHPRFIAGDLDTRLLDAIGPSLLEHDRNGVPPEVLEVAGVAATVAARPSTATASNAVRADPWDTLRGFRG